MIIGGGPTGCEIAGAIAEMARVTLPKEFRRIDSAGDAHLFGGSGTAVASHVSRHRWEKSPARLGKNAGSTSCWVNR
jgi:NADH dehydrogenase